MSNTIVHMNEPSKTLYSDFWRVNVDGIKADLRIWCIIGGTLAISYRDHFGTQRYNYCAKGDFPYPLPHDYKSSGWYPKPEDFTNGEDDIYNYVRVWHPRREIQMLRHKEIGPGIRSKSIYDRGNQCYGYVEVGDTEGWPKVGFEPLGIVSLSPVVGSFEVWGGRIKGNETNLEGLGEDWMTLARYAHNSPYLNKRLWELPDDVYETYKDYVNAVRI